VFVLTNYQYKRSYLKQICAALILFFILQNGKSSCLFVLFLEFYFYIKKFKEIVCSFDSCCWYGSISSSTHNSEYRV